MIYNLMIIDKGGTPLFNLVNTKKTALYSGFLTAINNFSKEMASGGLDNIELRGSKIFIKQSKNGLGVKYALIIENKNKKRINKKALSYLNNIIELFESEYESQILKSDGKINQFEEFKQYFEKDEPDTFIFKSTNKSIKESVDKFHKAFW